MRLAFAPRIVAAGIRGTRIPLVGRLIFRFAIPRKTKRDVRENVRDSTVASRNDGSLILRRNRT